MAFLTDYEARQAAGSRYGSFVESELRKSASAPLSQHFDIFLSHASEDATVIAGVKAMLERERFSVYVDWEVDHQLDRSRVTPETAELLRTRMIHSRYLVYVSSKASPKSKWMPWELGFFDGRKGGRIGILPIVQYANQDFRGLEYLGLYPPVERVNFELGGWRFGRTVGHGQARSLQTMVAA